MATRECVTRRPAVVPPGARPGGMRHAVDVLPGRPHRGRPFPVPLGVFPHATCYVLRRWRCLRLFQLPADPVDGRPRRRHMRAVLWYRRHRRRRARAYDGRRACRPAGILGRLSRVGVDVVHACDVGRRGRPALVHVLTWRRPWPLTATDRRRHARRLTNRQWPHAATWRRGIGSCRRPAVHGRTTPHNTAQHRSTADVGRPGLCTIDNRPQLGPAGGARRKSRRQA